MWNIVIVKYYAFRKLLNVPCRVCPLNYSPGNSISGPQHFSSATNLKSSLHQLVLDILESRKWKWK